MVAICVSYIDKQYDCICLPGERPDGWDPMPIDDVTHKEVSHLVVDIHPGSEEYINVEGQFSASMGTGFVRGMQRPYRGIAKIERIQNPVLYGQYIARKKAMDIANPSKVKNEQRLFHGCPGDVISNINSSGFNRSYCGKNGELNVVHYIHAYMSM